MDKANEENVKEFNNRSFEMIAEYCNGNPNSIIERLLDLKEMTIHYSKTRLEENESQIRSLKEKGGLIEESLEKLVSS